MKKLLLALLFPVNAFAQQFCSSDEMRAQYFLQDPQLKKAVERREAILEKETQNYVPARGGQVYIIPVVFHVIHNYGPENISDAQIHDAIRIVNLNYRKLNPDTTDIIFPFKSIAADCEIELRLAQLDTNGNCTSGINRIASPTTYTGGHEVKDLIHWDPSRYLNIYVVANAAGLAGHAVWPSDADTIPEWDGIVIKHDYVGSIGTSTQFRSVVLSHELGHYLNLHHIWGGNNVPGFYYLPVGDPGNCAYDDYVTDTPNTIGWSTCNLSASSCGSAVDNVQNFMDYAYCARMLTEGQKLRMHACLNSNIANRNNLWQTSNLIATGTDGTDYLCAASFIADKQLICPGSTVVFTDRSYNGVTTRQWTFTGGSPSSSTDSVVTVLYNTPGQFDVSLTAGDGTSTVDYTEANYITVVPTGGLIPYAQNFESFLMLDYSSGIYVINPQGDGTFQLDFTTGNSGTHSIKFDNGVTQNDYTDEFVIGPFDASSFSAMQIAFYHAYCQRDSVAASDQLKISVSGDCGQTWTIRKTMSPSLLETAPAQDAPFTPTSSQWARATVTNISSFYLTSNFMVKFSFTSDKGNNLFIDDINIAVNVGVEEESDLTELNLFPNPAGDLMTVQFNSNVSGDLVFTISDLTGRLVSIYPSVVKTGENRLSLDVSNLPSGCYVLSFSTENGTYQRRISIVR